MKNNRGQALVLFIALLPFIILLLGSVIELSVVTYQKTKITKTTKSIVYSCFEKCSNEEIENLFIKNHINYSSLDIDSSSDLMISISAEINSFLGDIFNKEKYTIKVQYTAHYGDEDKIIITKG